MTTREFRLPDPGEGLVEADIVSWRVAPGDVVAVNDVLLEVETSKSLVELPSPYAGTVAELLAAEGDTVDVGTVIVRIDDGSEQPSADPGPEPERVPVLVGYGPRDHATRRRPRRSTEAAAAPDRAHEQVAQTFDTGQPVSRRADHRAPLHAHQPEPVGDPLPHPGPPPGSVPPVLGPAVLAKPPVRKLARDLGVHLETLSGSGDGGVITRADVEAAAALAAEPAAPAALAEPTAPSAPTVPAVGSDTRVPVRGVRKATAEAMVRSAFTAPHVTEWVTCDVTAGVELLDRLRVRREFAGVKLSPLLLAAKAVCLALRRTPELNAHYDEDAGEIVLRGEVNLGVAAATPRGLMVPNVKRADSLGLLDLARALNGLVATAREGRATPADLASGSFTITNVGVFGVDAGTPILNPGETGILCLGAVARRPWVVGTGAEERIEPRWVTTLAVSFDHRVVDGEQGSRFLADVAGLLSDPGTALLF